MSVDSALGTIVHLPLLGLLLARAWGFFIAVPIFGTEAAPLTMRNGFALTVAVFVFPIHSASDVASTGPALIALIAWELGVGLLLGGSVRLLFTGLQLAGQLAGFGIGLSLAKVIDPSSDIEDSLGPVFYQFLGTVLFLIAGGHRAVLSVFLDSYQVLPVGTGGISVELIRLFVSLSNSIFGAGLRLAAPVAVLLFFVDLVLSLASRIVPQIPILIVGMPAKTYLGLAALGWGLAAFVEPCLTWLNRAPSLLLGVARVLAAAS